MSERLYSVNTQPIGETGAEVVFNAPMVVTAAGDLAIAYPGADPADSKAAQAFYTEMASLRGNEN